MDGSPADQGCRSRILMSSPAATSTRRPTRPESAFAGARTAPGIAVVFPGHDREGASRQAATGFRDETSTASAALLQSSCSYRCRRTLRSARSGHRVAAPGAAHTARSRFIPLLRRFSQRSDRTESDDEPQIHHRSLYDLDRSCVGWTFPLIAGATTTLQANAGIAPSRPTPLNPPLMSPCHRGHPRNCMRQLLPTVRHVDFAAAEPTGKTEATAKFMPRPVCEIFMTVADDLVS